MLPITSFVEEEGTLTNSSRVIQWKWKAADPFVELRTDVDVLARPLPAPAQALQRQGGAGAEPLLAVDWNYADPAAPTADEILKELNGKALADLTGPDGAVTRKAGEQLASFGEMKDDGSTDGCQWIYTGVYGPKGNFAQRRDNADPERPRASIGPGPSPGRPTGASSTTAPRRTRRASRGARRKAYVSWDAAARSGAVPDVPDFVATNAAGEGHRPVHHEPRGRLAPLGAQR